ncbi:PP2C family protein-serine/threonine phosphatase [Plantactinospora sp. CA-290183]|uniref:PP2C family protein-serine/threonine phosphatase n=1 Tax=Plantactinospora sp. CA-290183 TaxID=3240006 RepID=UPI003D8FEA8A
MSRPPLPPAPPGDPGRPVDAGAAVLLDQLYEDAPCGLLLMRADGTILRINRRLLSWLGYAPDGPGVPPRFQSLLAPGDRIFYETHYAPLLLMQGEVREIAVDLLRADGQRLPVLVNATRYPGTGAASDLVHTAVFTAIDRRRYERELLRAREVAERSETRARVLAQTLQASFLPHSLPDIPGVQVSAYYRPAGRGDEVGGDFYDVFQTAPHGWGVVLGDVCGKGAGAAVVTSLARHTVRAAAMRGGRPRSILATLNAALLSQRTDRFCTVAYARLETDAANRVRATISIGGHPPPVWTHRRQTREIGRLGTLLGGVAHPRLHERTVTLERGAALLFYTDGLTEARRGAELFGMDRLRQALAEHGGESAEHIVEGIAGRVLDFQDGLPHDDMAMVVVKAYG